MNALRIAATGMSAQQTRVEVISNNIANMSTTAYSARTAEFADLHYQYQLRPGAISSQAGNVIPTGIEIGLGVRPSSVTIHMEQGPLRRTEGDLDVAIEGNGFFEITLPSGEAAYSRDGTFKRSPDGLIVNSEGFALADSITIPDDARDVTINADGEVYAFFENTVDGQLLGQISLTLFTNQQGLEAIGSNLFRQTAASGTPIVTEPGHDGAGFIRHGFLEDSSVDVVAEIADLIEAQRGYELNSKVITAADEMLAATTRLR